MNELEYWRDVQPQEAKAQQRVIRDRAHELFEALEPIIAASHDDLGRLRDIRPVAVRRAIERAAIIYGDIHEHRRDAGRDARWKAEARLRAER